jgi:hypothetical protein
LLLLPDSKIVELMLQRGARAHAKRPDVAQQTYAEVFTRGDASARQKAIAAISAGTLRLQDEDPIGAIHHLSLVSEIRAVPFWLSCVAWMGRGDLRYQLGDVVGAVCDYTAVLCHAAILETHQEAVIDARVHVPWEWSPLELMGTACVERGRARMMLGDEEGAILDLNSVYKIAGMPLRVFARSRLRLAEVYLTGGRYAEVLETVKLTILKNAPVAYMRVLSAFAMLALGRNLEAIVECEAGLAWVRSTARLNFLEKHLEEMLRRPEVRVSSQTLSEIRDRLNWRRQELEAYAPTSESDRDF